MRWFKHYSNVQHNEAVSKLIAKHGFAGYGRYWALLEALNDRLSYGEDVKTEVFNIKDLRSLLDIYHVNLLRIFLQSLDDLGLMSVTFQEGLALIYAPILLELQSRDFKNVRSKRKSSATKIKRKIKIKKKSNCITKKNNELEKQNQFTSESQTQCVEYFLQHQQKKLLTKILENVNLDFQQVWLDTYQNKEFVVQELIKAYSWAEANPRKKPKSNWSRFYDTWLKRSSKNTPNDIEIKKLETLLAKFLRYDSLPETEKLILPKMLRYFKNTENFRSWANDMIDNNKKLQEIDSIEGERRYKLVSIKREIS